MVEDDTNMPNPSGSKARLEGCDDRSQLSKQWKRSEGV